MAFSVQMPALGESVTEGTVTRWLKQEGDRVEVDEPLLEVSTDKVDTEIPSPAAGVLQRIVAGEDETVEVGGELAVIGDGDGGSGSGGDSGADSGGDSGADSGGGSADSGSDSDGGSGGSTDDSDDSGTDDSGAAEAPADDEPADDERSDAGSDGGDRDEPADEPQQAPRASTASAGSGTAVTMPELGESVTEGTVTRWLKQVGDQVEVDEPLLEVSTDKVDTEIPSPVAGTLLEILAGEDDTIDVGGRLAVIGDADAAPDSGGSDGGGSDSGGSDSSGDSGSAEKAQEKSQEQPAARPEPRPTPRAEQSDRRPEPAERSAGSDQDSERDRDQDSGRDSDRDTEQDRDSEQDSGDADSGSDRPGSAPYVTPLVRKLAAEHGVDLGAITGSGVGGRIRKQDVLAAAEAARTPEPEPEPAAPAASSAPAASAGQRGGSAVPRPRPDGPEPGSTVKLPRLRQVIAQRMTESLRVSAQLTTVQQVDVTRIAKLRDRAKADFQRREGVKLTYLPFFAKATVEALKAFPQLNASLDEERKEVTYHGSVHLAVAVDTPRGLLVPVIKNAEELSVVGLAKRIADVAARTRDNKIGPDELSGGTFTLTNIGSAGALFDTPIINQPQVAILGTGAIAKQPAVVTGPDGDDVVAVRSMCFLPLTYDHRLVDGADAGRFVSAIRHRLEEGDFADELGL